MNTFKATLAFVLAAGLNTAAFAQTTPGTMPTTSGSTGTMQTTPGNTGTMQTTPGTMQTTPGTMRNADGTMQTTPGTMRSGTMQNPDGTMRTRSSSSDRRMKTKGNTTTGKGKMKDKRMN